MDLAIRIESYMNFAIIPPEKSELCVRPLKKVTVAGKAGSEANKNTGMKIKPKNRYGRYIRGIK
jgi:hypothetical protein